ncbi:retrovirus-related pol polyprotein from transposon TNT 1-94 [Tanacetum coccineum]
MELLPRIKQDWLLKPPSFESSEFPDYVCKLAKALYGLKQAPREWYETLSTFLIQNKFIRGRIDNTDDKEISICQEQYIRNLLKKYEIFDSSPVMTPMVSPNNLGLDLAGKLVNQTPYKGMIGCLIYLTATRLDIQFLTCLCARYQANPKKSHLIVVKRIFKYLKGTSSLGLWYPKCSGFDLKGYSDSDYTGCNMDRKSTSGACQILGGKLVCWSAKKQQSVAMSSAKAEYVVVGATAISNNPVLYSRTKHIDIRYHYIRDHILKGDIELHFIPIEYQLADIFIKPMDEPTFTRLKSKLGMVNID